MIIIKVNIYVNEFFFSQFYLWPVRERKNTAILCI